MHRASTRSQTKPIVKAENAVPSTATYASSAAVEPATESSPGYYGWRVVLAAHLGVMVSFGSLVVFTFGVFLKPLTAEFGWSREAVSRERSELRR